MVVVLVLSNKFMVIVLNLQLLINRKYFLPVMLKVKIKKPPLTLRLKQSFSFNFYY